MKNSEFFSHYFLFCPKPLCFFKHFNKKIIFLLLIFVKLSEITTQNFQTLPPNILSQNSTLYVIKNNENKNIILTSKEIFSGLEPKKLGNLENEFSENTEFTTYDSNYMLAVCTNNHLFIQFNINTQEKYILNNYEDFGLSLTTSVCSISYIDSYAYIIHTRIDGAYVWYTVIQIKLINSENGPIKGDYFKHYYYISSNLLAPNDFKFISCEAIKVIDSSESSLICINVYIDEMNIYYYFFIAINFEYAQMDDMPIFDFSESLVNFKIQRVNDTYARYIIGFNSSEIYLTYEEQKYKIKFASKESTNVYLSFFNAYKNLCYYNNYYIFHAFPTDETLTNYNLLISNSIMNNNIIAISLNKPIKKVQGFYDEESDRFIYVYQYANTIEYFILQFKCYFNAWYINEDNSIFCYDNQSYCESYEYYYHTDTRECVKSNCRDGYFQFNFECYKLCPENISLSTNDNKCESIFDYCYIDNTYKTHCSEIQFNEYTYKFEDTKIYFKNCNDSVYLFGFNTYLYQNICYRNCPPLSTGNIESGKCECNFFKYYLDKNKINYECYQETEKCKDKYSIISKKECVDTEEECIKQNYKIINKECWDNCPENTQPEDNYCKCKYHFYVNEKGLNCFSAEKSCQDILYPIISNTNECFLTKDICIEKGNKLFNNICYINTCPSNTYENVTTSICYCSFYYSYDSDNEIYTCFEKGETCLSKGYNYQNMDTKECFNSLDDCINRGLKIFNHNCYHICPHDTIINVNNESLCICKNYYFYDEEKDLYNCFDNDTTCIIANIEYQYSNIETKECFKTKEDCERKSSIEKCKYFDSCEPSKDYMFNNVCYKNGCPQGTILDSSNISSRQCICEENYEIDSETGLIICIKTYPEEFYSNKNECPYIYNDSCVLECPKNTCLNPNMKELVNCVDATDNIKVYNGICIEGVQELINNIIISNDDDNYTNLQPIQTSSGTTVNAYPSELPADTLIQKYPNLTYIYLGDCEEKLKAEYHLSNDTKLYILGIDSPNIYGNSSINIFNYEIYLKNGTQIKNLSACNEVKIISSSNINDLNVIKFDTAKKFSKDGYDLYNKSNKFYVDNCAPANDNGNDITLEDRAVYYYPSVDICNEGCDYKNIDYESKRFICECDIDVSYANNNKTNDKKKEKYPTYLDYFLSFINYKIVKCYTLFYHFESFYYNGGFYAGFITFFVSVILIFIFCFKTIDTIKLDFLKNFPTKLKLKELYRNYLKKRKENNKNNKTVSKDLQKSNPPPKYRNKNTINLLFFNGNKSEADKLKRSNKALDNKNNQDKVHNNINICAENKIKNRESKKINTTRNKRNLLIRNIINKDINNEKNKKLENTSHIKLKSPTYIKKLNNSNTKPLKIISLANKKTTKKINKQIYNKHKQNNIIDNIEANEELNIDFNFNHLIERKDEDVEKQELNEIPYTQALRIDHRNFFEIGFTVLVKKIGFLNLFFYRSRYSYLTLDINVYLFEALLDLTLNCFLYSEDVVSEKYHNNGSLSMFTSLALSIISNIVSSFITSIISSLTNYSEVLEAIILTVKNRKKYVTNIARFIKYVRIRLFFFHLLQLTFILFMTYYLFVFCTVYHNSQSSIVVNYIIGALTSLAFFFGLTIIITVLRIISLKCNSFKLYNTSRYLYKTF